MDFAAFQQALLDRPENELLLRLPTGVTVARHFHVTEVGKVCKDFIDCGGTRRETITCMLQTLVAEDIEHRILAGKLAGILAKSSQLDIPTDAPVEAEIQQATISIYSFESVEIGDKQTVFQLSARQTECLAPETCNLEPGLVSLAVGESLCKPSDGSSGCC